MDDHDETPSPEDVFRAFAMACRTERDRIELARLAAQDRRFGSSTRERAQVDVQADRIIRAAARC